MRVASIVFVMLLAGCAPFEQPEPSVIVKTVTKVVVEKGPSETTTKIVYVDKCPPPDELIAHCQRFRRDKDACEAEQRCQWVKGEKVVLPQRLLQTGGQAVPIRQVTGYTPCIRWAPTIASRRGTA
jgi:hypothetical protein